jgi:hypothetical protein
MVAKVHKTQQASKLACLLAVMFSEALIIDHFY